MRQVFTSPVKQERFAFALQSDVMSTKRVLKRDRASIMRLPKQTDFSVGKIRTLVFIALAAVTVYVAPSGFAVEERVNRLLREGHYKEALQELARTDGTNAASYRQLKDWVTSGYRRNLKPGDSDSGAESSGVQADFGGDIKEGWDNEKNISAVAITSKKGFGVMAKGTGFTAQSWASRNTFAAIKEWMTGKEQDGFLISSFAMSGSAFFSVMSKGTGFEDQTWAKRGQLSDMKQWIHDRWDEGYSITTAAMDSSSYFVVVSKGSGLGEQQWALQTSYEKIAEWIKKWWKEDYYLTALDSDGTNYFGVMSKGTGWTDQSYKASDSLETLKQWIQEKWANDYNLTTVLMTNKGFLAVMSKGTPLTGQTWFVNNL